MYDLIVIGGGPAGLTAAIYAIRKRLDMLLIARDLGGKTNYRLALEGVETYQVIDGREVVNKFRSEIEYLDFAHHLDSVVAVREIEGGFHVETETGKHFEARTLIVATGAAPQKLKVPGESRFMMRGLCYSAISFAPLFLERPTAVIGSGKLAHRATAELARVSNQVYLIAPEEGQLDTPLGRRIQGLSNVAILEGYRVTEIKGDTYARSVVVRKGDEEREIAVDGTFIELDLLPRSQIVASLVELDEQGRIKVDARNRTSKPGIFAAGDVTNVWAEQVLIAIGEGAKASLTAYEYLLEVGS